MDISGNHINLFLKKCKNANWAGVFFSSPFQHDFQFFLQDLNKTQTDAENQFIFHPFDQQLTSRVILKPHFKNDKAIEQLEKNIEPSVFWELPVLKEMQSTSKEIYTDQFKKYISAIQAGTCSKAILSTVSKCVNPSSLNIGEYIFQ